MSNRFSGGIAKKAIKCVDCGADIFQGFSFAWDNWRKIIEGRPITVCSMNCPKLMVIDEQPQRTEAKSVTNFELADLVKRIEVLEKSNGATSKGKQTAQNENLVRVYLAASLKHLAGIVSTLADDGANDQEAFLKTLKHLSTKMGEFAAGINAIKD